MSILLDDAIKNCVKTNVLIDGKWYFAKPESSRTFLDRCKDAISCLKGKSFAVHFKVDETE